MNPTTPSAPKPESSITRRVLRVALRGLGLLAFLLLLAAGTVHAISQHRISRVHSVQARPVEVVSNAETIERGRHLTYTRACIDCHDTNFGGKAVIDDPMVARLHAPNLTRGLGGLPEDYSDLDFVRAIRHGVGRDGRALVLMPSEEYSNLSDEDLAAMIAYLKSLPPVNRARGPVAPGPVFRTLIALGEIKLAASVINHEAVRPASVEVRPTAEYGAYLAASCTGCHGPNLSGGKIPGAPPDWPATSNLTPDPSGRLASWTEADFFKALRTHRRPDGTELHPVMPRVYAQLTDDETTALWRYLSSLSPRPSGNR